MQPAAGTHEMPERFGLPELVKLNVLPGVVGTCGSVMLVQLVRFQFSTSGCCVDGAGKIPLSNWPAAKQSVLERHEIPSSGLCLGRPTVAVAQCVPFHRLA